MRSSGERRRERETCPLGQLQKLTASQPCCSQIARHGSVPSLRAHTMSTEHSERAVDDLDEDVCKVCRSPGEDDDPLFYPCACKGSVRFVHQSCLQQWIRHSQQDRCQVRPTPPLRVPPSSSLPSTSTARILYLNLFFFFTFIPKPVAYAPRDERRYALFVFRLFVPLLPLSPPEITTAPILVSN